MLAPCSSGPDHVRTALSMTSEATEATDASSCPAPLQPLPRPQQSSITLVEKTPEFPVLSIPEMPLETQVQLTEIYNSLGISMSTGWWYLNEYRWSSMPANLSFLPFSEHGPSRTRMPPDTKTKGTDYMDNFVTSQTGNLAQFKSIRSSGVLKLELIPCGEEQDAYSSLTGSQKGSSGGSRKSQQSSLLHSE